MLVDNWDDEIPMTCSGCSNGPGMAGGGHFVSIQSFNESGTGGTEYVEMSVSDPLNVAQGYWTYFGTDVSITAAINYAITGPLVKGPTSYSGINSWQPIRL